MVFVSPSRQMQGSYLDYASPAPSQSQSNLSFICYPTWYAKQSDTDTNLTVNKRWVGQI
jgi:hypothetical protein